jgi:cyclic beta-1,2-glucan synthetase
MIISQSPPPDLRNTAPECDPSDFHRAGERLAISISATKPHGSRARKRKRGLARRILAQASATPGRSRDWLLDNARLLDTAEKQSLEFVAGLRQFPVSSTQDGVEAPRVCLIARGYLDQAGGRFSEESCAAFLDGFQGVMALDMGEIWGLKPALQTEILSRLDGGLAATWPQLITSLRHVGETSWKELFEAASLVHRALAKDPAGAYLRMDFQSRDHYRRVVGELAAHSPTDEPEVAAAAVALARDAAGLSNGSRAAVRRSHVGYYLIDSGLPRLRERVGHRPPPRERVRNLLLRYPTTFYLGGMEILTFLTVAGLLAGVGSLTRIFAALLLLLLPATQAALDFINHLVTFLIRPRVLPKLDFSEGIPEDCATVVAVPTLLMNEAQVRDLVLDLEIRFLANRDPNLYFALLTDSPDSDSSVDERDGLVDVCRKLIEGLNVRYPESPFYLFHRHRIYNDSEGRWMGWERKRGKLLDLNRYMRGGFDAFPVKVGDLDALPRVRYVITLDSDTQLPRESAAKLIGAIAHPLNAAVVDAARQVVVEGYGILQPRIGISIQSAARSRMAALYSGETGFDIYTRAVSDVYQDLFGEGSFTGKGIYEVDVMRDVLEHRFPENALLSHDLIEGAYARVALVSDIELIDDYPSHFSAYNRRKHRWVRGDWQILRWIQSRVPDFHGELTPNPINLISQWKLVDNLRRSLFEPAVLLLLLGSWFYLPGAPGYWTAAAIALLFLPVYWDFFFSLLRIPFRGRALMAWLRDTLRAFSTGHAIAFFSLVFLLHQALLSVDAIVRSVVRVFITRRKLLQWETAAEAEAAVRSKATVDIYLEWTPWLSILLAVLVWAVRPAALPAAAPILVLWAASMGFSGWLNRPPRAVNRRIAKADADWLRGSAEKICRYFRDWSSPATNWLIPDSVREDGEPALRLSPTNLGMLLNARIAAMHFGVTTLAEFIHDTRQTLDRVVGLAKHRGHLFNWYDVTTLTPLEPRFVSTVDSGNLAASLWTLKQAALAFATEPKSEYGLTAEMAADLSEIAATCDKLASEMDFRFLYHPRKKCLSVGYNVASQTTEPSCYDLLASEARIAVFVAIAKGDIPLEAWFHLGRGHTLFRGERILFSWTGTMFEYLMPALWMRMYPDTIMEQSIRAVVRVQREYANRKGVPWGISESACLGADAREYAYAPFGIHGLSLKPAAAESLVVSPYSSMLALAANPIAAVQNLRQMEQYGWSGRYGFYEAVDYTKGSGGEVIRSWMAHHQGMALLAICNLLFDNPMQRYFHAEPHVMATELLLHERVPSAVIAEQETVAPEPVPIAAPAEA